MILAAGRGSRMQQLTESTPKPLIDVAGESLIARQVRALASGGFTDLVINVSYLADQIIQAVGDGSAFGVTIHYSYEPEVGGLETGGGIYQALPLLGDAPFLVVSADVYTDFPYASLRRRTHRRAHLVLAPNPPYHPGGDFGLDGGDVCMAGLKYNYAGIGVISRDLFEGHLPRKFSLCSRLLPAIAAGEVSGELYQGDWFNIGTSAQLATLERYLTKQINL